VNVFFDVLGTLLSDEGVPRPRAREALLALKASGHDLYLWSSGGAGYAASAAELLGIADLIEDYLDKREGPEVPVDFAVDDDASMVEAHGGYRIPPFRGDPWDEELLRAAEAIGR
jgi:hypothetical protein